MRLEIKTYDEPCFKRKIESPSFFFIVTVSIDKNWNLDKFVVILCADEFGVSRCLINSTSGANIFASNTALFTFSVNFKPVPNQKLFLFDIVLDSEQFEKIEKYTLTVSCKVKRVL